MQVMGQQRFESAWRKDRPETGPGETLVKRTLLQRWKCPFYNHLRFQKMSPELLPSVEPINRIRRRAGRPARGAGWQPAGRKAGSRPAPRAGSDQEGYRGKHELVRQGGWDTGT